MIDLYIASSKAGFETIMEFASTGAMIQRKMQDAAQRRAPGARPSRHCERNEAMTGKLPEKLQP
ncbi:MAG: hypothetical protein J0I42_01810 [Bosea sp.]|uniref:hypothetical protein n=1 Tax=Bosea sp. (in: a-proteobacteria) TaxID=1871050 RepID=UPI001AC58E42|nr:hypothetical protein [Bosea sp. (in: a-proteobacteria)]MBN9450660.1 hypothetical protein [Bosea sp. (in: a-proteobacteria)]